MTYIKLDQCKHSYLYKLQARNLKFGVYRNEIKGFVGIREKFSKRSLDIEYHYDTGEPFGTAVPVSELSLCLLRDLTTGYIDNGYYKINKALFDWLELKEREIVND